MFNTMRFMAAAALLVVFTVAFAGPARAADEIYAAPNASDVRSQALGWVAAQNVKDKQLVEEADKLWSFSENKLPARQLLKKVVETFVLIDPNARTFVDSCKLTDARLLPVDAKLVSNEKAGAFYRSNLKLYYGRYLTQRKLYDEALEVFAELNPNSVVDPATCLFYKAVCEHQLLKKKEGLATIDKLLSSTEEVPVSYSSVATLMQYELEALRDKSLDQVARMMRDVQRRLDLARGGPKVQKEEDEIVAVLSEIIEKLEQQQGGGGGGGQDGPSRSNQSSSPANDSSIKGTTAPGNVDRKNFRKQGGWGDLPPKEEARAKNLINRNLPPHYKQATEQYFKKIARYRMKARANGSRGFSLSANR